MTIFKRLHADDRANALTQYALFLALVALLTIAGVARLRQDIITTFDSARQQIREEVMPETSIDFLPPPSVSDPSV